MSAALLLLVPLSLLGSQQVHTDPWVIGHRGARAALPENTLPSIAYALAHGADLVEIDVHETNDGVVVVHHNPGVNLTLCTQTAGPPIADKTPLILLPHSALDSLDCGQKTQPQHPGQRPAPGARIPTLEEALLLVAPTSARVLLEIKRTRPEDTPQPDAYVRNILAAVGRANMRARIIVQSFDEDVLVAVKKRAPELKTALLVRHRQLVDTGDVQRSELSDDKGDAIMSLRPADHDERKKLIKHAQKIGVSYLAVEGSAVSLALVKDAKKKKLGVIPWTVNAEADWDAFLAMGVTGIITDDPAALATHWRGRSQSAPRQAAKAP